MAERGKAGQSEEGGWAEGKGCHGVRQGLALSSHLEEFASRAIGSRGRVFKAGNGVSRFDSSVESGWEGSKADPKMVKRPEQ